MSQRFKAQHKQMKSMIRSITLWAVIIAVIIWQIIHGSSLRDILPPDLLVFLLLVNTVKNTSLTNKRKP